MEFSNKSDYSNYKKSEGRRSKEELDRLVFPVNLEKHGINKLSGSDIMEQLQELVLGCDDVQTQYPIIRERYCSLNVGLNERYDQGERCVPAPAFRPRLSRSNTPTGSLCDLSNDTQVIDLHYLYLSGAIYAYNIHAERAVAGKHFSFHDALKFAATAGGSDEKLGYLGYTPDEMNKDLVFWGALSLKPSSYKKVEHELEKMLRSREAQLRRRRNLSQRVDKKLWAALSVAEKMLSHSKAECSSSNLGLLVRQMIGKHDSPERTLKRKLEQVAEKFNPKNCSNN